jgi:hypothetical protein
MRADRLSQLLSDRQRAARIDDRNALAADDEADIRLVSEIRGRTILERAVVHEVARRDLFDGKRNLRLRGGAMAAGCAENCDAYPESCKEETDRAFHRVRTSQAREHAANQAPSQIPRPGRIARRVELK